MLQSTVKLDTIKSVDLYDCIFIPGGHGPMFDLATSDLLADMLTKAAAAGEWSWAGVGRWGLGVLAEYRNLSTPTSRCSRWGVRIAGAADWSVSALLRVWLPTTSGAEGRGVEIRPVQVVGLHCIVTMHSTSQTCTQPDWHR